jgi:hypothetical protein
MELTLNRLSDDVICVSGFGDEGDGVMQLDVMPQVNTVLCHG